MRDGDQVVVAGVEYRAAQRPRERQLVLRRREHIEQRHQIANFGGVEQHEIFGRCERQMQRRERLSDQAQGLALAA